MGPCQLWLFFGEVLLQGSELGMRASDLGIYRLICGEQTEDGKGSSRETGRWL